MNLTKLQNEVLQLLSENEERNKFTNRLKRLPERLKNKMTNARYLPQVDSVYVYNLNLPVPFTHREQPDAGYRYKNRNVLLQSKKGEINIYHQSIEIDGILKGITMVTLDSEKKRVEKFFKTIAKEIKKDQEKLKIYANAGKPVQLNILYLY